MVDSPTRPAADRPAPADPGADLCLLDADRCHYTVCLPARMAEADPRLKIVAARLQAIWQAATRGPVALTTERTPRSLFLLIDLDPHRADAPPNAYALQQQGVDILISGKGARAVALGVAQLLQDTGFRLTAAGAVQPPGGASQPVVWHARDRIELAPAVEVGWLRALGLDSPPAVTPPSGPS